MYVYARREKEREKKVGGTNTDQELKPGLGNALYLPVSREKGLG